MAHPLRSLATAFVVLGALAACGAPPDGTPAVRGAATPRMFFGEAPAAPGTLVAVAAAPSTEPGALGLLDGKPPVGPSPITVAPRVQPSPRTFADGMFTFEYAAGWRREVTDDAHAPLAFVGPFADTRIVITLEDDEGVAPTKRWQTAKDAAGDGLVRTQGTIVDELVGQLVISNQQTEAGPRYVRLYGFHYRRCFVFVEASWDKLAEGAPTAQKEVEALIKSWRWI